MTLQEKLATAAKLQRVVDLGRQAKQELEPLRFEILQDMLAEGSDKKSPVDGYYALKVVTPKRYVDDPDAVLDWLSANEYDLEQYKNLDESKIIALADEVKRDTGEIMDGLAVDEAVRVDLKRVKESNK